MEGLYPLTPRGAAQVCWNDSRSGPASSYSSSSFSLLCLPCSTLFLHLLILHPPPSPFHSHLLFLLVWLLCIKDIRKQHRLVSSNTFLLVQMAQPLTFPVNAPPGHRFFGGRPVVDLSHLVVLSFPSKPGNTQLGLFSELQEFVFLACRRTIGELVAPQYLDVSGPTGAG